MVGDAPIRSLHAASVVPGLPIFSGGIAIDQVEDRLFCSLAANVKRLSAPKRNPLLQNTNGTSAMARFIDVEGRRVRYLEITLAKEGNCCPPGRRIHLGTLAGLERVGLW